MSIESDIPEKEWVPHKNTILTNIEGKDQQSEEQGKGTWVQRAMFQSTFRLNCPPSFAVANIECSVRNPFARLGVVLMMQRIQYSLVVNVPFPGIGNSLRLEVPVNVTSGIAEPFAEERAATSNKAPLLDLPPYVLALLDQP